LAQAPVPVACLLIEFRHHQRLLLPKKFAQESSTTRTDRASRWTFTQTSIAFPGWDDHSKHKPADRQSSGLQNAYHPQLTTAHTATSNRFVASFVIQ
jgi:hypothetical protein